MKYFDIFENYDDFREQWNGLKGNLIPTDDEILFAVYSYENYSGYAYILFKRGRKLYEAQDGHCSCYGLENWEPEETTWKALAMRAEKGFDFSGDAGETIRKLIKDNLK